MRPARIRKFASDAKGVTAVEFALVMPVFFALVIGSIFACILLYSNVSLQNAVEKAARCYSVQNSSACGSASAAQAYAQSHYQGINSPTFTASTPACGHQVAGSVAVQLEAVLTTLSVPLSATACFP